MAVTDINATDLTEETTATLDGNEYAVLFDGAAGKKSKIKTLFDFFFGSKKSNLTSLIPAGSDTPFFSTGYVERSGNNAILYLSTLRGIPQNTTTRICDGVPSGFAPSSAKEIDVVSPSTGDRIRVYLRAEGYVDVYNYSANTTALNVRVSLPYLI